MVLLYQLRQTLSQKCGDLKEHPSVDGVLALQQEIRNWLEACPSVYKTSVPNDLREAEPEYLDLQRWQLQVVAYMIMLQPLKPYLTTTVQPGSSDANQCLQKAGVEGALHLIDASCHLVEVVFPISANFHIAVFTLFDTAAILCSSILHDRNQSLYHRTEVMTAIGRALRLVKQVSTDTSTSTAITSYNILAQIMGTLQLPYHDREVFDRAFSNRTSAWDFQDAHHSPPASDPDDASNIAISSVPQYDTGSVLSDGQRVQANFPQPSNLHILDDLDLGQLAEIWSSQELDFIY
jgi:hypothetical protein